MEGLYTGSGFGCIPYVNGPQQEYKKLVGWDLGHVIVQCALSLNTKLHKSISPNLFKKAISVFIYYYFLYIDGEFLELQHSNLSLYFLRKIMV